MGKINHSERFLSSAKVASMELSESFSYFLLTASYPLSFNKFYKSAPHIPSVYLAILSYY